MTRGVLGWGVPMALFMLLKDYYFEGEELSLVGVLVPSVLSLIGGYLFGLILWILNERSYRG
ncbi:MAG TPA: hypothetical protein VFX96_07785 [Pyrinomonadaceae bacterium]|nr:hypothetical protein [Pyrinomonadaceae bacterium]